MQTLKFVPYRVNLTPFAGLLNDGQPHSIALSVFNADNYFSATAVLLLYLDASATQLTGAVTTNTLAVPIPTTAEHLNTAPNGNIEGTVNTLASHRFQIIGYVNTPTGPVTTGLSQEITFSNSQFFHITGTLDEQNIKQSTAIHSTTATHDGKNLSQVFEDNIWPLTAGHLCGLECRRHHQSNHIDPAGLRERFHGSPKRRDRVLQHHQQSGKHDRRSATELQLPDHRQLKPVELAEIFCF